MTRHLRKPFVLATTHLRQQTVHLGICKLACSTDTHVALVMSWEQVACNAYHCLLC